MRAWLHHFSASKDKKEKVKENDRTDNQKKKICGVPTKTCGVMTGAADTEKILTTLDTWVGSDGRGCYELAPIPDPISPALSHFLGVSESARTDAVKKIWEYIKSNELQNPTNKKEIICDEKLKTIFDGKDRVGFLEIAKLLAPHFVKTA
ncbi:hypothetical protein L1987_83603 [Smallanthus sonchifolius]|uniref:Uncharacterized protein n=1 Tax=Smallanthus sonchifolius TaxID=185202 RepID=A0ACB8YD13_9ASTR|nr:hypothetical protein L1987_83603 [Smallanthus sonchifolius]